MMRTVAVLAALALPGVGTGARAAPTPFEPARLVLSATGQAEAVPDVLAAVLTATASGAAPEAVQHSINRATSDAVAASGKVASVQASLQGYTMSQDERHVWTGTATLALAGRDGEALLALVGRLQADGLALVSLAWELSPPLREVVTGQAERQAIVALRARAVNAADAIGLRLLGLQELRLDQVGAGPRPMTAMSALARAAGAPPLVESPQRVTATASATLLLSPR